VARRALTRRLGQDVADVTRRWNLFAVAMIGLLSVTTLAVLAATLAVTSRQMEILGREEQAHRAGAMATFLGRAAFVPAEIEDAAGLRRLLDASSDFPDLVRIVVSDERGRTLASREGLGSKDGAVVEASHAIEPAPGSRRYREDVGVVTVTLALARVRREARGAFALAGLSGALIFLLAFALDVSLIVPMTRRFRDLVGEARLAEELRRSNQELEQFAFVASHDLQEPLRKVVSYCQLLERRYHSRLDSEGQEFLRVIVDGSKRMSDLIKDLLSFSRVGTQGRPFEAVALETLAAEAVDTLKEKIGESGARVSWDALPTVSADRGQLGQLFLNLIGNALKFRGERAPEVRLSAQRDGASWRVCVRDNGIGIDPQYRDQVFVMFKRLNARGKYPGTGIGLAICKKIVERHGGRIWVESKEGEGASFYFTLPG